MYIGLQVPENLKQSSHGNYLVRLLKQISVPMKHLADCTQDTT
jgi:hypothetical protein